MEIFENVLTGSLGALAFLCITVWWLVTGVLHPDKAYQMILERNKLLEGENTRLNESVVSYAETNTGLLVSQARLESEIIHLREDLRRALQERR